MTESSSQSQTKKTIKQLSFEEAMSELEHIVTELEQGNTSLDTSITFYTRGVELKKHCEKKLNEAKLKVQKIQETSS